MLLVMNKTTERDVAWKLTNNIYVKQKIILIINTDLHSMSRTCRLRRGFWQTISMMLHALCLMERDDVDSSALRNHDLSLSTKRLVFAAKQNNYHTVQNGHFIHNATINSKPESQK